jgi:hypothetical protein
MELRSKFLGSGAVVNFVQVGHRHTAIEYAVAAIKHDSNLAAGWESPRSQVLGRLLSFAIPWILHHGGTERPLPPR